jgi:hypothetical protein
VGRNDSHPGDFFIYVVLRPLLFVFWSFVLWGTAYGGVLVYHAVFEGPRAVIQRALSGKDQLAGYVSVGSVFLAIVVWTIVGIVWSRARARKRARSRS